VIPPPLAWGREIRHRMTRATLCVPYPITAEPGLKQPKGLLFLPAGH